MAKTNRVLIVVVVLVIILFSTVGGLWSWGAQQGQAGVNLKVVYTDGALYELSVVPNKFQPMMIPIEPGGDKIIDHVDADILVSLQYDGTLDSYEGSLTFSAKLKNMAGGGVADFGTQTKHITGPDWDSGRTFIWLATNPLFSHQVIRREHLENGLAGQPSERYRLIFDLSVALTVTFDGGTSDSDTTSARAELQFEWSGPTQQITSLEAHVDATPLATLSP